MRRIKLVVLLFFALIATNCTQTKVVSFTDPEAANKLFNHIAVVANIDDLSDRLVIETKMVETLLANGVNAISSLSLFPPTREFTVEQENEIFKNNNMDAIAIIQIADAGFHVTSEPINVRTETRKEGNKEVSGTTVSGGGTQQKAFGQLRVSLIDIESNKTMWVGDADAHAFFDTENPDWDMAYLLKASSKKIAKELIKTGMIKINK
ncbi:hypothetical protein KKF86_00560 [bacterium]|nr:hypothetical protein [bacterium]